MTALIERWASRSNASAAALGLLSALPAAWLFRGFTVDDALITARVASHLAAGEGYRYNLGGPVVNAVTPLGYAHLLALGGAADPLGMLERARGIGLAAWLAAAAVIGLRLPRRGAGRGVALLVLAVTVPLAAWASSGMETGLVTLLGSLSLGRGRGAALAAGVAAALRPELAPWAVTLSAGRAWPGGDDEKQRLGRVVYAVALALGPSVLVAILRTWCFGSPAPLAVLAKPSDLAHGVRYAAGALVFTGAPLLLLAPASLRRAAAATKLLVLAVAVHLLALMAVGGDWMALYRLMVPVLPTALVAGAELAEASRRGPLVLRACGAVAACVVVAAYVGWPARGVLEQRLMLIRSARPLLAGARSVATLDVGWVGAATQSDVLDLAGVTDPLVARLPGGHTTKRVPEGLLESRGVDRVVLLTRDAPPDGERAHFERGVEVRVAAFPFLAQFRRLGLLPLAGTPQNYLVLSRVTSPAPRRSPLR